MPYGVRMDGAYWRGRTVFVTGHTGFKGAWLCVLLEHLGARVHGYALETPSTFLYHRAEVADLIERDVRGDIRDTDALTRALRESEADVVLHLAAQSVVRDSYSNPRETWSSNVEGTFSVLEAARSVDAVSRCVVVTTDKVYRNEEWEWGYRETDPLGGDDPYSASKACAELVTHAMAVSFPRPGYAVATARAGNVIGGGDATPDALVPELVASFAAGRPAQLRYPRAVRPWQHVLEPLNGYLTLAERLSADLHDTAWNFGPRPDDQVAVGEFATRMAARWDGSATWAATGDQGPHEAGLLALDSSRAQARLGWSPVLDVDEAIGFTTGWERAVREGLESPREATRRQVEEFTRRATNHDEKAGR